MTAFDIGKHALGLGVILDGLAGEGIKAIHLNHIPALCFGVEARTAFVVFGAFPFHLFFGGNANPDTDTFCLSMIMHSLSPNILTLTDGILHIILCDFNKKRAKTFTYSYKVVVNFAAMTYVKFKHELKRAKLSIKMFAELLEMNPTSITNYKRTGTVPQHLAIIAVMLAELSVHGCGLEAIEQKLGE